MALPRKRGFWTRRCLLLNADLPPNDAALKAEELKTLHERLLEERDSILKAYRRDMQTGQESVSEASEDMVDRATVAYSRELAFSISDTERTQLRLVDEALERIQKGTYGICQYSGQPIGFKRLQVVPWARFRVEYQEMMEQGLLTLDN